MGALMAIVTYGFGIRKLFRVSNDNECTSVESNTLSIGILWLLFAGTLFAAKSFWLADTFWENFFRGNTADKDSQIYMQGNGTEDWIGIVAPANQQTELIWGDKVNLSSEVMYQSHVMKQLMSNPEQVLQGMWNKFDLALANGEVPRNRYFDAHQVGIIGLQLPYIPFTLLAALGCLGFCLLRKSNYGPQAKSVAVMLALVPLSILATEVIFFNASRYRALGIPFLIPLAVMGVVYLWQVFFKSGPMRAKLFSGVFLILSVFYMGHLNRHNSLNVPKYVSVHLYQLARLQLVTEGSGRPPGQFEILEPDIFTKRLDVAIELYPENLEAYFLRQLYAIYVEARGKDIQPELSLRLQNCGENQICQRSLSVLWLMIEEPEKMDVLIRDKLARFGIQLN
jgi:hypothetical protein